MIATVFNGSGFVGRACVSRLAAIGHQLVIAYRGSGYDEHKLMTAGELGQIYFAHYNLKDEDSLHRAMEHSDVVVNTIGYNNETKNFTFDEVHVEGPRRMARIARECGVKKFIHLSSMNCTPNHKPIVLRKPSKFLTSKYYGELAVRDEFPKAIIFRPADIMGEMDDFMNHFTYLQRALYSRTLPIWDYYFDVVKQPVWLGDVVSGIVKAIEDDSADGKTYQAVGPYRYNFYDLIEFMRGCSGQSQKWDDYDIANLRWNPIARSLITITERLFKKPPVTWERIERDSTTDYVDPLLPTLKNLGVELTPLELKIVRHGYYVPRHHRVEIAYDSREHIDRPPRLNAPV